jgi:hypothetical protein
MRMNKISIFVVKRFKNAPLYAKTAEKTYFYLYKQFH